MNSSSGKFHHWFIQRDLSDHRFLLVMHLKTPTYSSISLFIFEKNYSLELNRSVVVSPSECKLGHHVSYDVEEVVFDRRHGERFCRRRGRSERIYRSRLFRDSGPWLPAVSTDTHSWSLTLADIRSMRCVVSVETSDWMQSAEETIPAEGYLVFRG